MRLRRRQRRCACLTSWLHRQTDVQDGILQEQATPAIETGTSALLAAHRNLLNAPHCDHAAQVQESPQEHSDEDDELFRCVLRELEFHEESEITRSASMSSINSLDSAKDEDISAEAPPKHHHGALPRHILLGVLRRLRLRELPDAETARLLVEQVRDHLRDFSSTLVRLNAPSSRLIIVGDLHGHLNDLHHLLDAYGEPSDSNQFLFNGDLVDRGDWGPEVLLTVYCLKLLHPDDIHINRGNHEDLICNEYYGFHNQITAAYPNYGKFMYNLIHESFQQLPLCHLVGDKIFIVHGGLPLMDITIADIEAVVRGPVPIPATTPAEHIFTAFLWSDPAEFSGRSSRGAGCRFDPDVTRRFLQQNGLSCIIRSHECVSDGIDQTHDGMIWTVFSASNYNKVLNGNNGCVLTISPGLEIKRGDGWNEIYVKERTSWNQGSFGEELTIARLSREVISSAASSPRERALNELRRMIFLARAQLLEAFEEVDERKDGRISPECWADVMSTCLRTPADFPWASVGPHLFHSDWGGEIAYVDFIFRYDNPFSRWLANQWCTAVLNEVSYRLRDSAGAMFESLDKNKGNRGSRAGILSYNELRPFIHGHLPATGREAELQAVHVLALFRSMDTNRSGFITQVEFLAALEQANKRFAECPSGHRLREGQFFLDIHRHECDTCGRVISRRECRRYCKTCDYDLCDLCVGRTSRVQTQWHGVEAAIGILCRSHCEVRALFHAADLNGDGVLDRSEFIACLGELLQGKIQVAEAIWDLAWQQDGMNTGGTDGMQGKMKVDDFVRCLAIIDTQR